MKKNYYIATSMEMEKRKKLAEEFYHLILDPEEIPYVVTDEAALYDFYAGNENDLIKKIKFIYQVDINPQHFKLPFWKLLDFLKETRKKRLDSNSFN